MESDPYRLPRMIGVGLFVLGALTCGIPPHYIGFGLMGLGLVVALASSIAGAAYIIRKRDKSDGR